MSNIKPPIQQKGKQCTYFFIISLFPDEQKLGYKGELERTRQFLKGVVMTFLYSSVLSFARTRLFLLVFFSIISILRSFMLQQPFIIICTIWTNFILKTIEFHQTMSFCYIIIRLLFMHFINKPWTLPYLCHLFHNYELNHNTSNMELNTYNLMKFIRSLIMLLFNHQNPLKA